MVIEPLVLLICVCATLILVSFMHTRSLLVVSVILGFIYVACMQDLVAVAPYRANFQTFESLRTAVATLTSAHHAQLDTYESDPNKLLEQFTAQHPLIATKMDERISLISQSTLTKLSIVTHILPTQQQQH